jgi:putative pyruvate formate lyase activating enzyme
MEQATLARGDFEAAHLGLERCGELGGRAAELDSIYRSCRLCPRRCGVDRTEGEMGVCSSGAGATVAAALAAERG